MRKAVTLSPGSLVVQETSPPERGEGEVLLDVLIVGLCGSDYHLFSGQHPYGRYPQTQGHEFTGRVRELPSSYSGELSVGDVVVVEPTRSCGTCFACQHGRYNCCSSLQVMGAHIPGALADIVAVPLSAVYAIGDLPTDIATLVEPVSIGLQAMTRTGAQAGDDVVVLGAGPVGLAAALAAVDQGARVLLADKIPSRLQEGLLLGVEATVDTAQEDLAERVAVFTGGRGAAAVIDATGVPALIRAAVEIVAHSGTVVIVGISDKTVELPVIDFSRKELNIRGSRNNTGLFPEAIDLVSRHREPLAHWITQRIQPEQIAETIEFALEHPQDVEKVFVYFTEEMEKSI